MCQMEHDEDDRDARRRSLRVRRLPYGGRMYIIYGFLVYALIFVVVAAVVALALYWVIRKAVTAGIRDARADKVTSEE